jgi:hypothetical protein
MGTVYGDYFMQTTASGFNPYKCATCQGNWYEERFFHANTRLDEPQRRARPLDDEIEHIPRVTRLVKPTGGVFLTQDDEDPQEHYTTVSRQTYVWHQPRNDSVTARRMNTSPEQLQRMLAAQPTRVIPDHSLPARTPQQQFMTIYRKSYLRHI